MAYRNLVTIHWLLRVSVLMEFVGHGAFGILGKESWVPYVQVFGFSEAWAWYLFPIVGTLDIFIGMYSFLFPRKFFFAYMAIWGLLTAILRPLSGEPIWELVERSYNFGVPALFFIIHPWKKTIDDLFAVVTTDNFLALDSQKKFENLLTAVQLICCGMLVGHGMLAFVTQKASLIQHLNSIGLSNLLDLSPVAIVKIQGLIEITLGLIILFLKSQFLFLTISIWKLSTEALFIASNAYGAFWEFAERGGAYTAPIVGLIIAGCILKSEGFSKFHSSSPHLFK